MKNILYIIGFICLFFTLNACDKKDGDNEQSQLINKYRVKRIYGTEVGKGDVQYLFYYNKRDKLDSVWKCDGNINIAKRDTIGSIQFTLDAEGFINTSVYESVLRIDADSVAKLKALYPSTYQDTLKRRRTSIIVYKKSTKDGINVHEKFRVYIPRENQGLGEDFNPSYLVKKFENCRYEYDKDGHVIVTRKFIDKYILDEKNTNFKTTTHKIEYNFSGNNIISANYFDSRHETEDSNESWEKVATYNYTYNSNRLEAVTGPEFNLVRSGNLFTLTESGIVTKYEVNDEGYVVKITYNDGSVVNVEYESGNGNFADMFIPIVRRQLGIPFIK